MSKLKVGRHARVLRVPPVNWTEDDTIEPGRVMLVEAYTADMTGVYLYDLTTPMIHGLESLPIFRIEDLEPLE